MATKKAPAKKKTTAKKATKKTATKKPAVKKAAKKAAPKKAAKKAAPKKAAKKAAPKKAAKKVVKKKAATKKTTAKKAAPKKAAKKVVKKKAATKKTTAKKTTAKKTTAKKAAPKKAAAKKAAPKKTAAKKAAPKKTAKAETKSKDTKPKTSKKTESVETPTPKMLKDGGKWLDNVFKKMELKVKTKGSIKGNTLSYEIDGEGVAALTGRGSRTLDSITTIMKSALLERHSPIRIDIGSKGAKEQQKHTSGLFSKVAEQLAAFAVSAKDSLSVAGFSSTERKAIHQVLEGDKRIKTESDGMGAFRKLRIETQRNSK